MRLVPAAFRQMKLNIVKKFPFLLIFSKNGNFFGPSVEIRTRGLLNPIQARYQTSPHPDIYFAN